MGQAARLTRLGPGAASLDPGDWGAFRRAAHDALERALDGLAHAGDGPVWLATPTAVRVQAASSRHSAEGRSSAMKRRALAGPGIPRRC